jgi:hypothetical protein
VREGLGRLLEWHDFVLKILGPRIGWACVVELLKQQDFSEPLRRTNTQPARELVSGWKESAWDAFVDFYR